MQGGHATNVTLQQSCFFSPQINMTDACVWDRQRCHRRADGSGHCMIKHLHRLSHPNVSAIRHFAQQKHLPLSFITQCYKLCDYFYHRNVTCVQESPSVGCEVSSCETVQSSSQSTNTSFMRERRKRRMIHNQSQARLPSTALDLKVLGKNAKACSIEAL